MKYKFRENFSSHAIYANGDVYNKSTGRYMNIWTFKGIDYYNLYNDQGKKQTFKITKLVYEAFYNETITLADFIIHKDGNVKNFHYTNLEKISRKEMQQKLSTIPLILNPSKKWVIAKGFKNYKVSNYGDIYSIKLNKMIKIKKREDGYISSNIVNDKHKSKYILVHRLVYDSFIGIKNKKNDIDHLNRIRDDNVLSNLKEKTRQENSLNKSKFNKRSLKVLQYDLKGNFVKEWDSMNQIKEKLGHSKASISRSCNGKAKTAFGFTWQYKNIVKDLTGYIILKTPDNIFVPKYKINKKGAIILSHNNLILEKHLNNGYNVISLEVNGNRKEFKVYRLVASSFINNEAKNNIVNHLDENKINDNVENLEWTTQKGNVDHSLGIKINQLDIKTKKVINTFNCINDAYRSLNKPLGHGINDACKGKAIQAYGYKWEYIK